MSNFLTNRCYTFEIQKCNIGDFGAFYVKFFYIFVKKFEN